MEIGDVFYSPDRAALHDWLVANHVTATEVWIQKYKKASAVPSISYDDMVEECLCFGWIDSVVKPYDEQSTVQRITPRRAKSNLSELNRQRVWKLQHLGLTTEAGIEALGDQLGDPSDPLVIPDWMENRLREVPATWETFELFPLMYRRLKVAWITVPVVRRDEQERRLAHLVKMTAQGKRYGTEPLRGVTYELD